MSQCLFTHAALAYVKVFAVCARIRDETKVGFCSVRNSIQNSVLFCSMSEPSCVEAMGNATPQDDAQYGLKELITDLFNWRNFPTRTNLAYVAASNVPPWCS